jgi:glycosyltransferase involved in cell wall biosynthesis
MRSLVIAPAVPADAGNGLAMRIGMFVEALDGLGAVDILVLPVATRDTGSTPLCRRLHIRPTVIEIAGRGDTRLAIIRSMTNARARLDAFRQYARPSLSGFLSAPVLGGVRDYISKRAYSYDVIHIARSYLLPVIDVLPNSQGSIVSFDLDEDDAETCRRIGRLQGSRGDLFMQEWNEAEALAFERQIADWLPRVDLSFIATETEQRVIATRYGTRPIVAGNAVALPESAGRLAKAGELLFVGGFGYPPNFDAAMWILDDILPRLTERANASVSLTLVGRDPPAELIQQAARRGATLRADVEDLAPFYRQASIALVPLRAGGGSRIKLLEAAAYGVPIVATSVGAENSGMEADLWVADTSDELSSACLAIWADPGEAARRASAARARVIELFSREAMISTLRGHFANQAPGAGLGD